MQPDVLEKFSLSLPAATLIYFKSAESLTIVQYMYVDLY
jgi:hypothetical protein